MKSELNEVELRRRIVGRFLRERRIKAGLTQWDVAKELQYSTAQFISNWERGVSLPPMEALPRLSTLFRATSREMIDIVLEYQTQLLKLNRKYMQDVFKHYRPQA